MNKNLSQKGVVALPITVGVMLIVFILVISVLSVGFSELQVADQGKKFQGGYYAADLGIQETLMRLTQDPVVFECPSGGCDLSSIAEGISSLQVVLTKALGQAEADAACPEFISDISPGNDVVQFMTSTAIVGNQSAVVQSRAAVKIDNQGKLTLCNWGVVN